MDLDKLIRTDLNLLVILQVLLEEESVTRAAIRLNLSQSALSKSLSRLRETLQDPLFTRTAHGLKPTTHALQVKQNLATLLQGLSQISQPPSFDPATSNRHFSISMLESAYATLLPSFIAPLFQQASNLHLDFLNWGDNSLQNLQQGKVDFAITGIDFYDDQRLNTQNLPTGIAHTLLFHDQQTCLVNQNHPALALLDQGRWDLQSYLGFDHLQACCEGNNLWAIDYFLEKQNKQRKIICTLPDFYGAASVCAHSNLIFTLPSCFVNHAQKLYPLVEVPLPFKFYEMAYALLWHQRNTDEPGHKWVREMICDSVANIYAKQEG
ncbi:LysR substrate-binding domain-containing protein [Psychromonas aquatilis]|uniref:LysR substrate-binding domain-containing protein n=1 Tax=Psychromonas aquatilis TaxID=2005072 RepID=A0ABU9GMU5_9GAMM